MSVTSWSNFDNLRRQMLRDMQSFERAAFGPLLMSGSEGGLDRGEGAVARTAVGDAGASQLVPHQLPMSVSVDVADRGDFVEVTADLPGLSKDSIDLQVQNGALRIHGERSGSKEERREGLFLQERSYGAVDRVVPLPDGVNEEDVQARYDNGVLHMRFGKLREKGSSARRITLE